MRGDVRGSGHGKLERLGWARFGGLVLACARLFLQNLYMRGARSEWCVRVRADGHSRKYIIARHATKGSASAAAPKSTYKPGSS